MENEFVTYELALRLKKLRYNESCLAAYINGKLKGCGAIFFNVDGLYNNFGTGNEEQDWVSAPTWQSAFRWFRKEHNLKSFIQPILDDVDTYMFAYGTKVIEHDDLDYLTHEEAETACLEKLIEIVEERNNE